MLPGCLRSVALQECMHMALWVHGCPYRERVGWVSECACCHARKICKAPRLLAALVRAWRGSGVGAAIPLPRTSPPAPTRTCQVSPWTAGREPLDCGTQAPGEWAVAQGFALLAAMYSAGRGCSLGTLGLSQGEHLSCNFPGER